MSKPKRWLKKALVQSSVLRLAGRFAPSAAVILAYHSIVENPQLTEHILGISRDRASFEAHMKMLAQKYNPVTIAEITEFVRGGRPLPQRAVAVTFDDGFADNYTVALPILARYGIPATFYIMVNAVACGSLPWYCRLRFAFHATHKPHWRAPDSDRVYPLATASDRKAALTAGWEASARLTGDAQLRLVSAIEQSLEVEPPNGERGFMMTWDQVRGLRRAGHAVGAHTLSHPNVAHVERNEARSEIVESKRRLEAEVGEVIEHFSYPHPALNPNWTPQTLELTREAGYKSAVLTTCGPVRPGDDPLALKRIYTVTPTLEQFTWNLQVTFLGRSI